MPGVFSPKPPSQKEWDGTEGERREEEESREKRERGEGREKGGKKRKAGEEKKKLKDGPAFSFKFTPTSVKGAPVANLGRVID